MCLFHILDLLLNCWRQPTFSSSSSSPANQSVQEILWNRPICSFFSLAFIAVNINFETKKQTNKSSNQASTPQNHLESCMKCFKIYRTLSGMKVCGHHRILPGKNMKTIDSLMISTILPIPLLWFFFFAFCLTGKCNGVHFGGLETEREG